MTIEAHDTKKLYKQLCKYMPEHDARFLLKERSGVEWGDLLAGSNPQITEEQAATIKNDLERTKSGEPISRILGHQEFWGLKFKISKDTLDPRPDTEVLVERALQHFGSNHPETLLDLGTGSGCIAIALLSEWPNTQALATDLSPGALETAKENAKIHGVENRIRFVNTSWLNSVTENFDCIVSNPPYIKGSVMANLDENVKNFDPILALEGGEDGLQDYKKIFSSLNEVLKPAGRAFLEIGYDQQEDIMRLGKEYRIRIEGVFPDYAGNPRVVDISSGDK
ncbi:peptide chain release factor N(5)-glutamine methyltransferase [Alphaproteobacteria bacterium]|nr:peptide chain release factor N(5)-glutamine methyltransferase [Alphaproteobacteria bacterium]